jgi:hypothetical protein
VGVLLLPGWLRPVQQSAYTALVDARRTARLSPAMRWRRTVVIR